MPIDRGIKMARKLFLSVLIATLLSSCGNIEVKESSIPPFSSMDISLSSIESSSSTSPASSSLSSNAEEAYALFGGEIDNGVSVSLFDVGKINKTGKMAFYALALEKKALKQLIFSGCCIFIFII